MKRRLIFILTVMLILFLSAGCGKPETPQISINQTTFVGGDDIALKWNEVKDADSYKICFYITPFSDGKLARSIELTDTSWDGSMSAGQYDIVVYALRRGNASDVSQVISITVESESVPSWDDINYIFSSTYDQLQSKYGVAAVETDTGSSVIRSYDSPVIDLTYPDNAKGTCKQIDIYDENFILFGLHITTNTQSDLTAALESNGITYENNSETTSAGLSLYTEFTYKNYTVLVHTDNSGLISYVTVKN